MNGNSIDGLALGPTSNDELEMEFDDEMTLGSLSSLEPSHRRSCSFFKVASLGLVAGIVLGWFAFPGGQQKQQDQHQQQQQSIDISANRDRYFTKPNVIVGQKQQQKSSPTKHESAAAAAVAVEEEEVDTSTHTAIHPQCVRFNGADAANTTNTPDRPMLILKYARTGSTWLVWSGQTLTAHSGKKMVWTSEAQACGQPYSDDLMQWFIEYFNPTSQKTRMRLNARENSENPKCPLSGGKLYFDHVTKDIKRSERKYDRKNELGSFVATIDWKISVKDIDNDGNETLTMLDWHKDDPYHMKGDNVLGKDVPDLTKKQWKRLFKAVPNLGLGVLVRTNSVKRAVSRLASEEQVRICGAKKLKGDEECIKDLPEKVHINTTLLFDDIVLNDMKRDVLLKIVADISTKLGDGKIFCLSYESMQRDISDEMHSLGQYLGADIDPKSLQKLHRDAGKTSYKRGSDDLSKYLANYDEVRDSLSAYPCLVEQLEDKSRGKDFPSCNLWQE